ncbi:division/cell wall cluster transcriptional repressor MraZ [Salinimonas lutimaris]|uniref:division/cell wall cluster transcriptional repressor MraZ n=1 Tax=Salinimonas lutimaris TaxID=914153 RepID=UPI0010C02E17|nr:division/cell wall cluster transcriptional repressor MraZ [Salinimonas lutimaris]
MFRGANTINLDAKGRLAIPTKYRQPLLDDCTGQLVCTVDLHHDCLLLYPLPEWEELELKLSKLSNTHPAERRVKRLLLGHAAEVDMDKSGRVLVPPVLRTYAGLDKEIILMGQLTNFEIWDAALWRSQVQEDMEIERGREFEPTERLQDLIL